MPVGPALVKAREIARRWCGQQLSAPFPPTIIHLTRGKADSADLQEGASAVAASPPPVALYHFVVTEEAHPTVTLPDNSAQVNESLRPYWECSSMLLLRDELRQSSRQSTSPVAAWSSTANCGICCSPSSGNWTNCRR